LTLEGKSLIVKTFGISQLVYNMQCVDIKLNNLKRCEQLIFNFLWGTKNIEDPRARDRMKRSIMKNDYNEGGLKITDIECLDKSLKLRQYIRANNSNHTIKEIQSFCVKKSGGEHVLAQEFAKINDEEDVCKIAQETINIITDNARNELYGEQNVDEITSLIAITQISMIKAEIYLKRKGRVFLNCKLSQFRKEGLQTYLDLVSEAEVELCRNRRKRLESIIAAFPKYFRNAANNFDNDLNEKNESLSHFLKIDKTWIPVREVTTKDLQWILKKAMFRITETDFERKTEINHEIINPLQLRKVCKNSKTRNIYFRMIHNDFFTYKRMFAYKMSTTPNCPRCGQLETSKHLLWDCVESKSLWKSYNNILNKIHLGKMFLNHYEDLYRIEEIPVLMTIKLKLVQELVQIIRPTNWCISRTINLIVQLRNVEMQTSDNRDKKARRWDYFANFVNID
jgi:hypothetical protein